LKAKFKSARESLDNNYFPEEILNEFADYLEWVVEQGPLATVYPDAELKKFFFEEFVGGIAKRLKNIKQLPDQVIYFSIMCYLVSPACEPAGAEHRRNLRAGGGERQLRHGRCGEVHI
jgi:hypothetical protein